MPKSTVSAEDLMMFKKVMRQIINDDGCFIPDQESFELVDRLTPAAVVEVMLYDKDGRFLMKLRDDKDFKGWHTPGGRFPRKKGETVQAACLRTLKTDGILAENVVDFRCIGVHSYLENEHPYAFPVINLIACLFGGDPRSVESETAKWFTSVPEDLIVVPGRPEIKVPHAKYVEVFKTWFAAGNRDASAVIF